MNYVEEGLGIARAAQRAGMPVAISFTVETDGKLPTGQTLQSAIEQVDDDTSGYPCLLHDQLRPSDPFRRRRRFGETVDEQDPRPARERIANEPRGTERVPHARLGEPGRARDEYADLKRRLTELNVMGGCCGTDHRHVEEIAVACAPLFGRRT